MGATDDNDEGNWRWVDNTAVDLTGPVWRCSDPKDNPGLNCAGLEKEEIRIHNKPIQRFRMFNLDCAAKIHFICEANNSTVELTD